jgi:RNA 3'-terminal phosphate cyclase (ATP)
MSSPSKKMNLRDLLNQARWRDGNLHTWSVDIVHRGLPGDRREVLGSRIAKVLAGGIEIEGDESDSDTIFIPYHRFLQVRGGQNQVVWDKVSGLCQVALACEVQVDSLCVDDSRLSPGPTGSVGRDFSTGNLCFESASVTLRPRNGAGKEVSSQIDVLLSDPQDEMLVIDGSAGEGGGQVLRSALTLSLLTRRPFTLKNIRAGRKKPGLMRQHLTCVHAAAAISKARVKGDKLRSMSLVFRPGSLVSGDHVFNIGTAGSVCLVLQTLALPLAMAGGASEVTVAGGTHTRWAPPFPFLAEAWLPLVQRMGVDLSLELRGAGFYPAGGGKVVMTVGAGEGGLKPLYLDSPGQPPSLEVDLKAVVSNIPEGIARRELQAAAELLGDTSLRLQSQTLRSPGPGNAIWLIARGPAVTQVFTAIGEKGKGAEEVGLEVASRFVDWRDSQTSVCQHLTDQLMIPLALAGSGRFSCQEPTMHSWTNIEVVGAFTGRKLLVCDLGGGRFEVGL